MKKLHFIKADSCLLHYRTGGFVVVHSKSQRGADSTLKKKGIRDFDSMGIDNCSFCGNDGFRFFIHDNEMRKVDKNFLKMYGIDWLGVL